MITVHVAAPAIINNILSFIIKEQFMINFEHCPNLIEGFKRSDLLTLRAPRETWERIFDYLNKCDVATFNHIHGMTMFAIYMYCRNCLSNIEQLDIDPLKDDPFFERKRLFEIAMQDIIDITEEIDTVYYK